MSLQTAVKHAKGRPVHVLVLWLATPFAVAQQNQPPSREAKTLVESLYQQVVVRHPIGIPQGKDMRIFGPYLSKALLHRIDLATACGADWHRQNPGFQLKPEYAWLELDLFSGDDEEAEPSSFVVERAQPEKVGSVRVNVKLTYEEPGERPWTWHVAAIALRENGRYVVDDILFLKEDGKSVGARLSAQLAEGCAGPRWVGLGGGSKDQ